MQNISPLSPDSRRVRPRDLPSTCEHGSGKCRQMEDAGCDVLGKQIEKSLNILGVEVLGENSAANGVRELELAQVG